jgi:hypothetical protein
VAALENAQVLPEGSLTYPVRLVDGMSGTDRRAWHAKGLEKLGDANVVFVDPDNGIRTPRSGSKPAKVAYIDELADYSARGQSIVIYHHADRSAGGVTTQVPRRLDELAAGTGIEPLGAVIARRGSTRFFFIVPAAGHRARLAEAVRDHVTRWAPHVEYIPRKSHGFGFPRHSPNSCPSR